MKYRMAAPTFPETEIEWLMNQFEQILRGEAMLSSHKHVKAFEEEFAAFHGTTYAVATNTCSAALEIGLAAIGIKESDQVIVPVETFIATASSIARCGATPIFADIDRNTYCLSLESIKRAHTEKTSGVLLVHMAGRITDEIFAIKEYCEANKLFLMEDAAHAHGASIDGQKAGSIGDVGCFSFYPTKLMTTGEGGMLTTNNLDLYKKSYSLRSRGLDLEASSEQYNRLGTNNRMTEIAAAMGRSQLKCLPDFLTKRNSIARKYHDIILKSDIADLVNITIPPKGTLHAYWRFMLSLSPNINREELRHKMAEDKIAIDWAYFPPVHLQPVFKQLFGTKEGMLPESEKILSENICLPIHPQLTEENATYIANRFIENIKQTSRCLE